MIKKVTNLKILSIDTSSKICTVCIYEDNNVLIELNNDDERTHSQKLMPMIQKAFESVNLTLNDINLIACAKGPGSFTGIRIGIATAKAFSDVKKIPVVGVTSLEGLAYNLGSSGLICSLIDAKNNNVYYGLFEFENNELKNTFILSSDNIENVITYIDTLQTNYSSISFIGDGAYLYKNLIVSKLSNKFNNITFAEDAKNLANSISIAKAAYNKYNHGEFGDSNSLVPTYLRACQAERSIKNPENV
ncbi:MAG TPA: tRNA (adenosine(37)-N6)-threonylcarbamoyltransferase complex dimerization subunit type 1 TsaB [Clostridiales bacterium]|nr:tRNA (adenosine(37)-N6)-threonylcarbamoyltransferase complex dimerization subunit type 1 TsaB [Clostridiales bacterium]